jgi:hypothetical protein
LSKRKLVHTGVAIRLCLRCRVPSLSDEEDISSVRSIGIGIALSDFDLESREGEWPLDVDARMVGRRIGRMPYKRLGSLDLMGEDGSWV